MLAVKQKWGALAYQAFPRSRANGHDWTQDELRAVDAITAEFGRRSESVCEWCGAPGTHRARAVMELTLCDTCDSQFSDPPLPSERPRPRQGSS
jgi:hypothetical protein